MPETEQTVAVLFADICGLRERAEALKKVKELCKEFGFTAGMLKGALAEGRKKK